MGKPEKIILGYDPGTTIGLAFLSLKGKIIRTLSKKHAGIDETINLILKTGTPVLVATDKRKIPSKVDQLASNFKTKVFSPEEDLPIEKKRELCKERDLKNLHERDATAAALHAYHNHQNMLRKIEKRMDDLNLPSLAPQIKELVLRDEVKNISDAVDKVLETDSKDEKTKKKETKMSQDDLEERIEKFRGSLLKERKDKDKLKKHNQKLKERTASLKERKKELKKELKEVKQGKKDEIIENEKIADLRRKMRSKENEIRSLKIELEKKESEVEKLKKLERLRKQGKRPLRVLNEMTYEEIETENKKLALKDSVILFERVEKEAESIIETLEEMDVKAIIGDFSEEFTDELIGEGITVLDETDAPIREQNGHKYIDKEVMREANKADKKSFLKWLKRYRKGGN